MELKQDRYVRFEDWSSERTSFNSKQQFSSTRGLLSIRKPSLGSMVSSIRRGFERGSERMKSLKRSLNASRTSDQPAEDPGSREKVFDPQGAFLQQWNKIFVVASIIAVSLDPLFFYIPVIDNNRKCLDMDNNLKIIACVLRSITDLFYTFHIILQFRTGFISPTSRVFGRGEMIQDLSAIAKRYLYSYFFVDILAVLPLPQVLGAFWYLFTIERKDKCWRVACHKQNSCDLYALYCGEKHKGNYSFLNTSCPLLEPEQIKSPNDFNFGIFLEALQSKVVEKRNFWEKLFYCFWWGLRNLSSLGQNLKTSNFTWENLFAIFISVIGLILFSLLIGNMQKYLQSITVRVEEMRVKRRDVDQWMSHRMLPENLRQRIRRHEQYKWQETRGVEEDSLIQNLPKDLRRDINRHHCWALLTRVPMFEKMDDRLLDALCDRLKPVLYTENSCIYREGDPVDEMLFLMRGSLLTTTTNGGRTGFFNSVYLKAGDFCGEELLTWALDPNSNSSLPTSTRTVLAVKDVEAFALKADDLRFVASQFRRLHSKQLQHTFRFYSQQWRTWAACFIQAAWRRHCRKRHEKSLRDEEDRLQGALANGGNSPSLAATIYASKFAANALRALRRNHPRTAKVSPVLPSLLLQKPAEPDFNAEDRL
ncbi:cyclic nucleotide-gated ion channel 1 isoform X2 [Coffea eugenioides]|uniref:cyclic nucleotide-gated ion channel 1 isoform X2 n=1 Tax=Coffea eugenioides TaxID=49369 RepID=UPI000F60CF8D|nr:cyclic nucleotide-gated ion channel 1 isoform X2 [Coffea eugenioides]